MYAFQFSSNSEHKRLAKRVRRSDMQMHKKTFLKKYWRSRKGTTVVEYALIMTIISVILVVVLPPLSSVIAGFFEALSAAF